MSYEVRIVGGGEVGERIADRLEYRGDSVVIVEVDADRASALESTGHRVHRGDGTDTDTLDEVGMDRADVVVVATGDDDTNLLATQLVRNRYAPEKVIARVNRPENADPFEDLGIRTVSRSDATAQIMDLYIESPALTRWMEAVGHRGEVQEVVVENPRHVGSTIRELEADLPDQVLLVMVGGETDAHLPDLDEVVEAGDHVTLMGERSAVRDAMADLSDASAATGDVGEATRETG